MALNNLSCVETVVAFAYPVNLSDFPTYALSVDYCVDLQTIAERLKNHFYRFVVDTIIVEIPIF